MCAANLRAQSSSECGTILEHGILTPTISWELCNNGTLTISGTGAMPDFSLVYDELNILSSAPWGENFWGVTAINISSSITSIGNSETVTNVNFTVNGDGSITPDGVTGTPDVWNMDINIYPNPFTGAVRIICAVETWHAASLRVVNAAGAVVHIQQMTNPDETIRLEHLPAGAYFFTIENGHQSKTIKLIKH